MGLCFNCDEPFSRGHKCKHLFDITIINDDSEVEDVNTMMMVIDKQQASVLGNPPMYLSCVINGAEVHILVDLGTMHNVIDVNSARLLGLLERHIDTTVLVGSGNEVPCRAAAFAVPLRINDEIFSINAFLLDIGNDVNIVLSTPWLTSLGRLTWDFTNMELQYYRNGNPITFTTARRQQQALAPLKAPPQVLNMAQHVRHPSIFDHVDLDAAIFVDMRREVLEQRELRHIALAITDGTATPTWSMEHDLLFFDGRFYLAPNGSLDNGPRPAPLNQSEVDNAPCSAAVPPSLAPCSGHTGRARGRQSHRPTTSPFAARWGTRQPGPPSAAGALERRSSTVRPNSRAARPPPPTPGPQDSRPRPVSLRSSRERIQARVYGGGSSHPTRWGIRRLHIVPANIGGCLLSRIRSSSSCLCQPYPGRQDLEGEVPGAVEICRARFTVGRSRSDLRDWCRCSYFIFSWIKSSREASSTILLHDCPMHEYAYLGSPLFNLSGDLVAITYLDQGHGQAWTVWQLRHTFRKLKCTIVSDEIGEPAGAEAQVEE